MALRLLIVLLVISLSWPATSSSASKCSDGDTAFLDPLVSSLMQWIADNSRYELADHFVPRIEFVPNEDVDRLANPGRTVDYWQDVDACFMTEHITIYLSEDFDWRNVFHRSTLVHELVHFMQLIKGAFDYAECPAALERPANFFRLIISTSMTSTGRKACVSICGLRAMSSGAARHGIISEGSSSDRRRFSSLRI